MALGVAALNQRTPTSGVTGGVQVGYNYHFARNFVAGVETDIDGIGIVRAGSTSFGAINDAAVPTVMVPESGAVRKTIDYLGTLRGRIGLLVSPTLLAHITAGLAYGGANSSVNMFQVVEGSPHPHAPGLGVGSYSAIRTGWTAGGGIEWLFLPNWSAKFDYLYYDLGGASYSIGPIVIINTETSLVSGSAASRVATRFDGHILRAGMNYHFE